MNESLPFLVVFLTESEKLQRESEKEKAKMAADDDVVITAVTKGTMVTPTKKRSTRSTRLQDSDSDSDKSDDDDDVIVIESPKYDKYYIL